MRTADILMVLDIVAPIREAAVPARSKLPSGPLHIKLDGGTSADRLNSQLWTGGAITTDQDVQKLEAAGITAIIDNRLAFDDASLVDTYSDLPSTPMSLKTHPLIDYYWNGQPDDGAAKPVSWFSGAWVFAKPILDRGGVLLSHCSAGHHRGPSVAYFLLRAYWDMSPQAAQQLIQSRRPEATLIYRADADAAIVQLGLAGPNHEVVEMLPVPSAAPDALVESWRYPGLLPSELRRLREHT